MYHLEHASNTPGPRKLWVPNFWHFSGGKPRRHLGESNRWSALPLPPPSSSAPELLIGCRSLMQMEPMDFGFRSKNAVWNLRDVTLFCLTNMGHRLIGNHFPYQKHYCHLGPFGGISHLQAEQDWCNMEFLSKISAGRWFSGVGANIGSRWFGEWTGPSSNITVKRTTFL